jgi:high-affinity iron transporter
MAGHLGQIAFVVWRESVEALLVVGILDAWLVRQMAGGGTSRARHFLWGGVLAGVALAILLGLLLFLFSEVIAEDAQVYVQTAMVGVAAALILQMVFWMRRHGGALKRNLEQGAAQTVGRVGWWGLFVVAMLAVAREGSEAVVFLYGLLASASGASRAAVLVAILLGAGVAFFSYWALQFGSRHVSWRHFFRVTEIVLLFLAASLIMTGADNLISLGWLPASGALWDSSRLIEDSGPAGSVISALTGYRAKPDLINVLVYAVYWALVLRVLWRRPVMRTNAA